MPTPSPSKNVLIVELNEFNSDLMAAALKQHDFPTLRKIFSLPEASYKTQDRYNSGYLEPWVQWVSIHTGTPSTAHGIKHLGDVPHLHVEQCWETLSKHNISTGVWGVMNGERRSANHNHFFLPDPWTFSEWATPSDLNQLLTLPRYLAKNYQNLSKIRLVKEFFRLVKFIARSKMLGTIGKEAINLIKPWRQFGAKHCIFISCFDYLSTQLFIQYKKKYQPRCSYLFLNSLAHLQHHHWREGTDVATPEIVMGLHYLERAFSTLVKAFPEDAIVVHNGLSQMNTNHEKPWVLYRQKDPRAFLKALGLPVLRVEQHMTHDGHVFFANQQERDKAYELLVDATLKGKPLFHVEKNEDDPQKLFYMLAFTDAIDPKSSIDFVYNHKHFSFFKYFDRIVTRTGRHIPMGKIYSSDIHFPDHIQNHEFNRYVYHYLLPDIYPLPKRIDQKLLDIELV